MQVYSIVAKMQISGKQVKNNLKQNKENKRAKVRNNKKTRIKELKVRRN
jgi:hypothetical protein